VLNYQAGPWHCARGIECGSAALERTPALSVADPREPNAGRPSRGEISRRSNRVGFPRRRQNRSVVARAASHPRKPLRSPRFRVVFSGSFEKIWRDPRAFSTKDGSVLLDFDTNREFPDGERRAPPKGAVPDCPRRRRCRRSGCSNSARGHLPLRAAMCCWRLSAVWCCGLKPAYYFARTISSAR